MSRLPIAEFTRNGCMILLLKSPLCMGVFACQCKESSLHLSTSSMKWLYLEAQVKGSVLCKVLFLRRPLPLSGMWIYRGQTGAPLSVLNALILCLHRKF